MRNVCVGEIDGINKRNEGDENLIITKAKSKETDMQILTEDHIMIWSGTEGKREV